MKKKMYFEYHITKWDASGNVLLEFHKMIVQRQSQQSARNVVRKKYTALNGYFEELNNSWAN